MMNALEAGIRLEGLKNRRDSLARIIDYMDDDRDFRDEIHILSEIQAEVEAELAMLEDKLRAVQL